MQPFLSPLLSLFVCLQWVQQAWAATGWIVSTGYLQHQKSKRSGLGLQIIGHTCTLHMLTHGMIGPGIIGNMCSLLLVHLSCSYLMTKVKPKSKSDSEFCICLRCCEYIPEHLLSPNIDVVLSLDTFFSAESWYWYQLRVLITNISCKCDSDFASQPNLLSLVGFARMPHHPTLAGIHWELRCLTTLHWWSFYTRLSLTLHFLDSLSH